MQHTFDRIRAAAVDSRAHNIYYRQQQLESLFKTLIDNADKIRQAIANDYGHTSSEIAVEFNLTLSAVRKDYTSLQPKKFHEDEYAVANGKDAADCRVPAGMVYIEPTVHTLFYSTIVPMSAAIAAGNCTIVVLENKTRETSILLRQLLPTALSADTFAVASSPIADTEVLSIAIRIDQNGGELRWPRSNELVSFSHAQAVAVVDRTANIEHAAKELVNARLAFGGTSPYAPDIILVNEFVKEAFLQAVVDECKKLTNNSSPKANSATATKIKDKITSVRKTHPNLTTILEQPPLTILDLPSPLPQNKIPAPILLTTPTRSLDNAIDLLNHSSQDGYSAAYHFSDPASAKYLSQFVPAAVTFVNHIPFSLLLGPACPFGREIDVVKKYAPSFFSIPRPVLATRTSAPDETSAEEMWKAAVAPLKKPKRAKGGAVGFFEQGFLMNAALILTGAVAVSGTGGYWVWRFVRGG